MLTTLRTRILAIAAVLTVAIVAPVASAADLNFPTLSGRVVDQAGILSAATETRLTGWLAGLETQKGAQVVVVTLPNLQGVSIEDFGYRLGRAWGIGEAGRNTGAVLIVAPTERAVRIEVGYGLEGTLTDALSRAIIEQDLLPAFRAGNFEQGIVAGTASILRTLGYEPADAPPATRPATPANGESVAGLVFFVLMILFIAFQRRGRRRSGSVLPYMLAGWAAGSLGHGRRGSSGGGGGSFRGGGGSFGGGGASGRW